MCKVRGGITNKFCDDGISNNKNTPPEYRKNVSEVQNYKTFPGKSSPRIAVFYLSTQQQLLYPTNSYCMVVEYSQKVKRGNINRPFYRYGGHIELIRFEEYYRMPRGHEHISLVFSSAFRDIFS